MLFRSLDGEVPHRLGPIGNPKTVGTRSRSYIETHIEDLHWRPSPAPRVCAPSGGKASNFLRELPRRKDPCTAPVRDTLVALGQCRAKGASWPRVSRHSANGNGKECCARKLSSNASGANSEERKRRAPNQIWSLPSLFLNLPPRNNRFAALRRAVSWALIVAVLESDPRAGTPQPQSDRASS